MNSFTYYIAILQTDYNSELLCNFDQNDLGLKYYLFHSKFDFQSIQLKSDNKYVLVEIEIFPEKSVLKDHISCLIMGNHSGNVLSNFEFSFAPYGFLYECINGKWTLNRVVIPG